MLFDTPARADDRQLRQFAWALVVFVSIVLALRWWRGHAIGPASIVLALAGWSLGLLGAVAPRRIEWLFVGATTLTRPIGRVVSECMLAVMYFGVITPVALLSRLVGRDPLQRRIDRRAATYWTPRKPAADPSRYFRES